MSTCTGSMQIDFKTHPGRNINRSVNQKSVIVKGFSGLGQNLHRVSVQIEFYSPNPRTQLFR